MGDTAAATTGIAATATVTGASGTAEAGATGSAGGTGTPAPFDWTTAGLVPEHLNLVTERGWKTPGDVMTSYRHLESATGVPPERLIKLPAPKDANNAEAWNKIHTQLGRPETAEKYVIPVPEGDKGEFANAVKPWLYEAGISQSAATKLATKWNEFRTTTLKAQQAEAEQKNLTEVSALKQSWGADYEAKAALVDRAAEQFGMTQPQLDALKSTMGPKAAMEFLHNIGSKIAVEDRTVPGMSGQTGNFALTPEAAQAKLLQLKGDREFAKLFNSADLKQKREARDEIRKLELVAYPGMTTVSATAGRTK